MFRISVFCIFSVTHKHSGSWTLWLAVCTDCHLNHIAAFCFRVGYDWHRPNTTQKCVKQNLFSLFKQPTAAELCIPDEASTLRHLSCKCTYGYNLSDFDSMNATITDWGSLGSFGCLENVHGSSEGSLFSHLISEHVHFVPCFHVLICNDYHGMNSVFSLFLWLFHPWLISPL